MKVGEAVLKIAICDDEPACRERVAALVKEYGAERHVELAISAYSVGAQVLDAGERFEIYLLDILMPGLGGVGLAAELRQTDDAASIIFLTSSPEFALESYSVHALDYILKPVDRTKLFHALDRAITCQKQQVKDELLIRSDGRLLSVSPGSIEYVEARQDKLLFNLCSGQTVESIGSLAALEEQMHSNPHFVKPHRAYLVNMAYIRVLDGKELCTSDYFLPVPIARGRFAEVKKAYLEYMTFSLKRGGSQ